MANFKQASLDNHSINVVPGEQVMEYAYVTKPGTREKNEDSVAALENDKGCLFVVADGLGGHSKGEVASAIATDTFRRQFENTDPAINVFIPETFIIAQSNIIQEQKTQNALMDMKTTCAALVITNGICQYGHVGDTRIYVFQQNRIKTRTLDHSVPQMLVVAGDIKEKKIRKHPDRNQLLRVMGIDGESPRFELSAGISIAECQAFLLCSDGFWELCLEKKMCAYLKKSGSAFEWLRFMTDEVEKNGQGGEMDNYSAIAVFV